MAAVFLKTQGVLFTLLRPSAIDRELQSAEFCVSKNGSFLAFRGLFRAFSGVLDVGVRTSVRPDILSSVWRESKKTLSSTLSKYASDLYANQVLRMPHQTSSTPELHTGQGKGWWRTLLKHGVVVLRLLPCVGLTKASMSPLMDLVGLHNSESVSSPSYSVDEEAANFDNETKKSVICTDDVEAAAYGDITKRLAKGKYQAFSDGSTTDSCEDEYSTDDDEQELKQAMLQSIFLDRELEDWISFRTSGATFHKGETSGASTSYSHLSELQLLEMIHF